MAKARGKKLADFLSASDGASPERKYFGHNSGLKSKKYQGGYRDEDGELFDFLKLVRSWPKIVGPAAGQHTLPLKFTRGVLNIVCSHPAWAKELALLEQDLNNKIKQNFPGISTKLKSLKFMTGPSELQRIRETIMSGGENSPNAQKNFQKLHPHSPHYKKLRLNAEQFIAEQKDSNEIEDNVKELLISLIIQCQSNE